MKLYTQLNFGGNCEEAFSYYAEHLGGKIAMMMKQNQAPGASPDAGDAVMHARMTIGDAVITGNDVPSTIFQPIRSVYMHLTADSASEAERIHAALADGGQITMPMAPTFFATHFSQVRDRFGVLWSIVHERA